MHLCEKGYVPFDIQLIVVPTVNLKSEPMEMFEWEMRVQAIQNNVFISNTSCIEERKKYR